MSRGAQLCIERRRRRYIFLSRGGRSITHSSHLVAFLCPYIWFALVMVSLAYGLLCPWLKFKTAITSFFNVISIYKCVLIPIPSYSFGVTDIHSFSLHLFLEFHPLAYPHFPSFHVSLVVQGFSAAAVSYADDSVSCCAGFFGGCSEVWR